MRSRYDFWLSNQNLRTTDSPTFAGLTVDTDTLYVDATNDRVGIGTTTPEQSLDVYGNINDEHQIRINNANTGTAAVAMFRMGNSTNSNIASISVTGGGYTGTFGANSLVINNGLEYPIIFATVSVSRLYIKENGDVGIGTGVVTPVGQLHIDQSSGTGAQPVLTLDQGDVSEEFIRLIGTSTTDATQSLVDVADMTTPGNIVGWFKIYIQDDQATNPITDGVYYVPFYSVPTS